MQTVLNDVPVEALFVGDSSDGGTLVECQRCKAHTKIPRGEFAIDQLFTTRCSYCEAKLSYPEGASW